MFIGGGGGATNPGKNKAHRRGAESAEKIRKKSLPIYPVFLSTRSAVKRFFFP
jgi:hypothetical protein